MPNLNSEALKLLEIQKQLLQINRKLIASINAPERAARATKQEKQVSKLRKV